MNLARNLLESAARFGDVTAVKCGDDAWTYACLDAASARLAGVLRERGVEPGDRVGLMLPNVCEFPVVYFGILRAGAVVVPLDTGMERRDVARCLGGLGARLVFAWHACAEEAEAGAAEAGATCLFSVPGELGSSLAPDAAERAVAERAPSDPAVVLPATGEELTHGDLLRDVDAIVALHGLDPAAVTLGALPLRDAFGQTCSLNATIAAAGCLTLLPRLDAEDALAAIDRDGVTVVHGDHELFAAMRAHPRRRRYDLSTVDQWLTDAAADPARFTKAPVPLLQRAK